VSVNPSTGTIFVS
jgi:hypothetical protein